MRSSSSVTVGKIARTSSLWATYSPHWTGTPISLRLSRRRTLRPRRAAYRAAVAPAGPPPNPITSVGGGSTPPPPEARGGGVEEELGHVRFSVALGVGGEAFFDYMSERERP